MSKKKTIISEKYDLQWRDILKGLVVAILTPVIPIVQQSLSAGELVFDWNSIAVAAAGGFMAYIVKNFFSPTTIVKINPTVADVEYLKQTKTEKK